MTNVTFKIIGHGAPQYKAAVALREDNLRKPLGLSYLQDELEEEKDHIQIVGLRGKKIVATAVLVPEGKKCKVQRVVVTKNLQNSGIGSQLLVFCENCARNQGFESIYCHARDAAVNFYQKNHYIAEGDYFLEDKIPHLKMRKSLTWAIHPATKHEVEIIHEKFDEFLNKELDFEGRLFEVERNYTIKEGNEIIAGITTYICLSQILYIRVLCVGEAQRNQGYGSILLKKVEDEAKPMGVHLVHLTTFHAKDFYIKHGYEVFGVLDDCPKGFKRYFMKKKL